MSDRDNRLAHLGAPVIALWREPYAIGREPDLRMFREGMTVYEIVKAMDCLPADFERWGSVQINGHEINRGAWHLVRPKATSALKPIEVTFTRPLRGGGGGGGAQKQVIGIVAMLALTFATAGIGAGALGFLGGSFGAGGLFAGGTIGAKLLAGAVGIMGALAISALTRPPTAKQNSDRLDQKDPAGAEGNVLEPNGTIPRVIGTRKVFPPLASEAYVELVGDDEYAYAVYVLAGAHEITNIKAGDAAISDDDAVEYQVREGFEDDTPQTLVTKIGRTTAGSVELKGHQLASGSDTNLEDQTDPEKSLPKWQRVAAARSPDNISIQFIWPSGLIYTEDPSYTICLPLRIRMRQVGDTDWINLPELHYAGTGKTEQARAQVLIHWDYDGDHASAIPGGGANCWAMAHLRPPGQTVAPADATYQWEAHDHFYDGSGTRYVSYSDSLTGIQNLGFSRDPNNYEREDEYLKKNTAHIYLDSATFPQGTYEIEIMRGGSYRLSLFTISTYLYQSTLLNHFRYYGATFRVSQTQRSITDNVALARVVSTWDETPTPVSGLAIIAIKVKNKQVQAVSCNASGYVYDWDGSGWNTLTTTSNPAPHFRDVLVGRLNQDPLPVSLLDNDGIVDWRSHCTNLGYTCDYIANGGRVEDVLTMIASCGYAQPYWSDTWGVILDHDRSGEPPVQVFTQANSRGFQFRKALARLPDGLRITYRSDDDDYSNKQVMVYRTDGVQHDTSRIEQVTYDGLVSEAKIEARGTFDLRQAEYRSTFYSLEAPVEYIKARRGSLVAVQHDILTRHAASGRINSINTSGSNIVSIVLDTEIEIPSTYDFTDIPDVLAEDDILSLDKLGCTIRHADGSISTHEISNTAGFTSTITFTTPFANQTMMAGPFDSGTVYEIEAGCLVAIGPMGREYLRLIVTEIMPGEDLTARLTMVDEAPELWA